MSGNLDTPEGLQAGLAGADAPRIEQEIRARYAGELATADICDQLQIEVRIRAEIAQALAASAPRPAGA